MFVNWLVKLANKVPLAQMVAGFDYLNAMAEYRLAEINLVNQVRDRYFAVLVAREGGRINRSLVQLADEVYGLQLKQLAAGQAAGYEPLQLYSQAVQARNSLAAADATALAAWRQLAAALNQPTMPPAPLIGRVDAVPPDFDLDAIISSLPGRHTDLIQARNTLAQAEVNLTLQRRIPIPDLQTNSYYQYDTLAHAFQFGLQFGFAIPIADKNQGNIHAAQARIGQARENLVAVQNDLTGRIAEAYGRYSGARVAVSNFREGVLPNLVRAYRGIIRRYQVEPDKVGFNDIVVAQQNLSQALQSYLSSLDSQWRAAVDLATAGQLEELYPVPKK
jgi:cobalt-zinc-cadmium efflux system outer membrane protein